MLRGLSHLRMVDDAGPQRETSPLLARRLNGVGYNRKLLLATTAALSLAVCGIMLSSLHEPIVMIGKASTMGNTATQAIAKARAQKLWSWEMQ